MMLSITAIRGTLRIKQNVLYTKSPVLIGEYAGDSRPYDEYTQETTQHIEAGNTR